jgi:DNA (cytosine-5)-methyltransferase 1
MKFIDLFAGIGGFHLALSSLGLECVFACEWDKYAQETYFANFGIRPTGDINQVKAKDIPEFDILCAGFPCQPFSIAGVSKKNSLGRKHGFDDEKQGNLFFEIMRIAKHHRPKVLFLENVKNLLSHDKGNTWSVIHQEISALNYEVFYQVIDGKDYVPQHRQRIFIIAFDKNIFPFIDFKFPQPPAKRLYELKAIIDQNVSPKYTLTKKLWEYLYNRKIEQQGKGNGFGYGLFDPSKDAYTRTISARYYKDGSEVLIEQAGEIPRRLTPRECARLQGYPDDYKIVVSDMQAYKQFGNSVVVPVVKALAEEILRTLNDYKNGSARQTNIQLPLLRVI